jgi:hypothetical protein
MRTATSASTKSLSGCLSTFEGVSFYECLSARMRNYMLHSIKDKGRTPLYYRPADGKDISADDVARFFGCQLARSLRGNPSIQRTWSTRELLDAIGTCMECMPKNAFQDIYTCLHFDDNWDGGDEWDDMYADSKNAVRKARQNTARSSPCSRTASTVGGRSAQLSDAG